ncbi:Terminase small subunit [uncultured Caudovirales phage]|jgi:hypothetical protein|uniref:Terminase small subunit n=1 Tax=uncultured Caudovirales phage TaxID=2100421 RepID=A0A6J7XSE5_9CAUD|nr:Terminase small subunit [uncultured Caudovirales phage]
MTITTRQARRDVQSANPERREAVRQELEAIGAAQITDVVSWTVDKRGNATVEVIASDQLSERARRSIKKIKVTPTEFGNQIEVEMHDKLSALRVLAKTEGLLNGEDDQDKRPSLVGINLRGPVSVPDKRDDSDG